MSKQFSSSIIFLSYVMADPKFFFQNRLEADDFPPRYNEIAEAYISLVERNLPTDPQSVMNKLTMAGAEDEMDSFYGSSMMEIANTRATWQDAKIAHENLVEWSKNNAILKAAEAIFDLARNGGIGSMEKLSLIGQELTKANAKSRVNESENAGQAASKVMEKIRSAFDNGPQWGIRTGIDALDNMTLGFEPGQVVLIGGRPAMGKSALGISWAAYAAANGSPALIFSMEMSKEMMIRRMISTECGVSIIDQRKGDFTKEQLKAMEAYSLLLESSNMYLECASGYNIHKIIAKTAAMVRSKGIKVVVLDYLQLIAKAKEAGMREGLVEISKAIKDAAETLGVTFYLPVQLNRKCEEREDKRPMLSDLGESGQIEQDADIAIFLYRDEYYNKQTQEPGIAELIVRKHRQGETGTIKTRFNGKKITFENLPADYDPNVAPFDAPYQPKTVNVWDSNPFRR